jgi:hypothetical protein
MILDDQLGQTQAFRNFQNIEYGSFVTFIFCRPSQSLCTVDLDKNKRPGTFSFRKLKVESGINDTYFLPIKCRL